MNAFLWISLVLIIQLLFRMEILLSIAWGSWPWDLGCWHSWLGFLWFRFVWDPKRDLFICFLLYVLSLNCSFNSLTILQIFLLYVPERLPSCNVASKRDHFFQVHFISAFTSCDWYYVPFKWRQLWACNCWKKISLVLLNWSIDSVFVCWWNN